MTGSMTRVAGRLVAALWLAAAPAAPAATIEGVVALPARPAPAPASRYTQTVGEVRDPDPPVAVVYVEGTGQQPKTGRPVAVAQEGYQFTPGLVVVPTGSVVEFPNHDPEYHSVFSYSKARRFDLGRFQRDERPPPLTFEGPGVVKLYCDIHEHMRGTILVVDTPYFQKTDAGGRYRIDGLPAGHLVVKAWLDETTVRERTIDVGANETRRVDFPAE
jgi:plastocyanin